MRYKIGYVDEDPSQVKKYERDLRSEFDVIGYNIYEGLPLEALIDQVYESDIDLLLIDYLLVDRGIVTYNGDEVARAFEEVKPRFPTLIFTNLEEQAFPHVDNPNIIYGKEEVKQEKFFQVIKKNIENYKNYIEKRKNRINELLEKATKEVLTAEEKHELYEDQFELNNLDKRAVEVPYQLLSDEKINKLSDIANEAKEFLNSLIKENKDDSVEGQNTEEKN